MPNQNVNKVIYGGRVSTMAAVKWESTQLKKAS